MPRVCRLRGGPSSASDFRFAGIGRGASNWAMDGRGDKTVAQRKSGRWARNCFAVVWMHICTNYKRIIPPNQTPSTVHLRHPTRAHVSRNRIKSVFNINARLDNKLSDYSHNYYCAFESPDTASSKRARKSSIRLPSFSTSSWF